MHIGGIIIKKSIGFLFLIISSIFIWKSGWKSYIKNLSKYISPIVVIAFYIFDLSITRGIDSITPIYLDEILKAPTTRLAVDSALATLIFNFISFLVITPGKVEVNFTSKQRLSQVGLKSGKTSHIDINIKINYRYKILRGLVRLLGGFAISIANTSWTSIEIDRRDEYGLMINYDNPSEEIIINSIVDGGNISGNIYFLLYVSSNITVHREGCIKAEFRPLSNSKIKKSILNLLKGIILDVDLGSIEVINIDVKVGQ